MSSDSHHLAYLASNADDLSLERYEIERHLARLELLNVSFPCSDEGEGYDWNLSRKQIEKADIFILLIGDTYGPVSPIGISYLHREYVHARTLGKPIYAFIKTPDKEIAEDNSRLQGFRQLVKQQVFFKVWHFRDELIALLSSTISAQRTRLGRGWVRNTQSLSSSANSVREPLAQSLPPVAKTTPPPLVAAAPVQPLVVATVAQPTAEIQAVDPIKAREVGRKIITLEINAKVYQGGNLFREVVEFPIRSDQLYKMLAPALTEKVSEDRLRSSADASVRSMVSAQLLGQHPAAHAVDDVRIQKKQFHGILQDWMKLGVVRSKTESNRTYWELSD